MTLLQHPRCTGYRVINTQLAPARQNLLFREFCISFRLAYILMTSTLSVERVSHSNLIPTLWMGVEKWVVGGMRVWLPSADLKSLLCESHTVLSHSQQWVSSWGWCHWWIRVTSPAGCCTFGRLSDDLLIADCIDYPNWPALSKTCFWKFGQKSMCIIA